MEEHELELLRRHPQWQSVLNVYQKLDEENRLQIPDFDGWVSRIHEVPDVAATELPGIHGKLIAFGFLKFDLAGRDGGIRYQLTHHVTQDEDAATATGASGPKAVTKAPRAKRAVQIASNVG